MSEKYRNKYNSDSHRLNGYDYRTPGWYFITICSKNRRPYFGEIRNGIMGLSFIGLVASRNWQDICLHFENVLLDEFIVMPDHIHGLIGLKTFNKFEHPNRNVFEYNKFTGKNKNQRMSEISPRSGSISSIIRSYKGSVTRWCNKNGYDSFSWQSRFYDHVVRDEDSLNRIREYIYLDRKSVV